MLCAPSPTFGGHGGAEDACTFVCISDTHSRHEELAQLPPGDVLLHAGDFTRNGTVAEVSSFAIWWHAQPHAQKVLIAGNHERCLDKDLAGEAGERAACAQLLCSSSSTLLCGDSVSTVRGGYTVFGAPWTPQFWGAFNRERGEGKDGLAQLWARIPTSTDVVVTHGPAAGHGDYVPRAAEHVGCHDLLRELLTRVRPAIHVCGHIHESAGVSWQRGVAFMNASICNREGHPVNAPVVFTLRRRAGAPAVQVDIAGHAMPLQRGVARTADEL